MAASARAGFVPGKRPAAALRIGEEGRTRWKLRLRSQVLNLAADPLVLQLWAALFFFQAASILLQTSPSGFAVCGSGQGAGALATSVLPAAGGWLLMLGGMMTPLLLGPLRHVLHSSPPDRRLRSTAAVMAGYGANWIAAGLLLVPTGLWIKSMAGPFTTALAALAMIVWMSSPWAQAARNRCHRTQRIGVHGWRASRDGLLFGAAQGRSCVVLCWPAMLTCLIAVGHHEIIMLILAVFLFVDRQALPARPRWALAPGLATGLAAFRRA
jgi:predicted metal-binding membrane protein